MASMAGEIEGSGVLAKGMFLGSSFGEIVEKSLKKGKLNNNVKCVLPPSKIPGGGALTVGPLDLELNADPSFFTSLAVIRKLVLRDQEAACERGLSLSKYPTNLNTELELFEEQFEDGNHNKDQAPQIPQVVVISLQSIFDLIQESQKTHPQLCLKVLKALLGILQNLLPESLTNEPCHVVEPLFKLLLTMTIPADEDDKDDSSKLESSEESLSSLASSCLLSLVVAWGITPKLLQALNHLLTVARPLAAEEITLPNIMLTLQRGVQSMVTGTTQVADWFSQGIQRSSLVTSFSVSLHSASSPPSSISCDGSYIYLVLSSGELHKIGTGFGGSVGGQSYAVNRLQLPYTDDRSNLLIANEQLLLQCGGGKNSQLVVIDRDTLSREKNLEFSHNDTQQLNVLFSDGSQLGSVCKTEEDEIVSSVLEISDGEICSRDVNRLKLALQSLYVVGSLLQEEKTELRQMYCCTDDGFTEIAAGKEFVVMLSTSGKISYLGRASSLGLKNPSNDVALVGEASHNRWNELPFPKGPTVTQCTAGHEGQHAILVDSAGTAFFVGLSKRGEDGDLVAKHRRQSKTSRPKRFSSMEGKTVIAAACNNGTSALVTREGDLYLFGKDTMYCDATTGQMVGIANDVHIVSVALGKAHGLALTDKGTVYTFGINNKGQCGRDGQYFSAPPAKRVASDPPAGFTHQGAEEDAESEDNASAPEVKLCAAGEHHFTLDHCMVCTVCHQCSGFGSTCVNTSSPGRSPGTLCGCGSGDAGCSRCGICRTCALDPNGFEVQGLPPVPFAMPPIGRGYPLPSANGAVLISRFIRAPVNAFSNPGHVNNVPFPRRGDADDPKGRDGARMEALIGAALNADAAADPSRRQHRHSHRRRHPSEAKVAAMGQDFPRSLHSKKGPLLKSGSEVAAGSDVDRDANKLASLSPGLIQLPDKVRISQVACGLHHSVMLTSDGQIYTFGSNSYGQLGLGDLSSRGSPTLVKIPSGVNIVMITAGSHHSAALTSEGDVLSWGAYAKGQLARNSSDSEPSAASTVLWHTVPGFVTDIGPRRGKRASWIRAFGDQTFIKLDESLVSDEQFNRSTILASKQYFVILPTHSESSSHNLVVCRSDGQCRSFAGSQQVDFRNTLVTWDPVYGVLWSICKASCAVRAYNVRTFGSNQSTTEDSLLPVSNELEPVRVADIFRPALTLPVVPSAKITQTQAALHLLCCLDSLTRYQQTAARDQSNSHDKPASAANHCHTKEDYSVVNRFESHGGGWGYSGHSVEAIRFMTDADVELGGFSLFGGRGEYYGKIKVFDLGPTGGEQECDGEMMAETDEVVYECGARQRYPILFPQPVRLQAGRWYLAWARVNGPSSDCGSGGLNTVTTEDQVTFTFKSSKKSNNGTDVNAGQIPQILFRVISPDSPPAIQPNVHDAVHPISHSFSKAVTPDSFSSLLSLIRWAWSVLKTETMDDLKNREDSQEATTGSDIQDVCRVVFVCRVSLRLLRFYVLELYPLKSARSRKPVSESEEMARSIVEVRDMLRSILGDPILKQLKESHASRHESAASFPHETMLEQVVEECHDSFVSCFHVFFPTSALKWTVLCELLDQVQKVAGVAGNSERLLAAVLDSLCSLHMRLRSALPDLYDLQETAHSRNAYQSPDMEKVPSLNSPSENGSSSPGLQSCVNQYPILIEHMVQGQSFVHRPCRAVLDRLFLIATWPVRQALDRDSVVWSDKLVQFACRLLARVVAELTSQINTSEDLDVCATRSVQATPSRFTSVSQNRSWNTGNGSPDAVCFTVDNPNISIVGVGVFGGGGNYTYELELLELVRRSGDSAQTLSWHSLAVVRGSYGPDDCVNDVAEIKFDRPVPIKESTRYTLRLRNQGGKTHNGDGGLSTIKGPDGTSFTFSACLLSFNGTNHIRGQLPYVLYCNVPSNVEVQQSMLSAMQSQVRKSVMSITSSIVRCAADLLSTARSLPVHHSLPIIAKSHIVSYLLPFVVANIGVVAESDPRNAVQILELIRVLLPHVSALCLSDIMTLKAKNGDSSPEDGDSCITTSSHVVLVESEHPYRPATVTHYRACFPESVRWMCLEFDSQCCTAQVEDSLQLFLPYSHPKDGGRAPPTMSDYWPVLNRFGGSDNWPTNSLLLPGREVVFSLETASDYVRGDKTSAWGFRCSVVGYEWQDTNNAIRLLEAELSYLGGMCAASLMKGGLSLPLSGEEINLETIESATQMICSQHSALLGKGIALSHLPTIHEALQGNLPFSVRGKERQFLHDFVTASEDTSGGRLARWLQPEPVVDLRKSQLLFPGVFSANVGTFGSGLSGATVRPNTFTTWPSSSIPTKTTQDEEERAETIGDCRLTTSLSKSVLATTTTVVSEGLRAGWPCVLSFLTRDQYGHLVHVPDLKVEIRAVPCNANLPASSTKTLSTVDRVAADEGAAFAASLNTALDTPYEVTIKDRMCLHAITFLKAYEDFSFEELRFMSPTTRRMSESMLVRPDVDGSYNASWTPSASGRYSIYVTVDGYPVDEVYEVDVKEPPQGVLPPTQHIARSNNSSPNLRVRQFRTRNSAGLRVRAQPSLQGEQIGVVYWEGTITFVEELRNDDGVWLRLSTDSIKEWCYNGHFSEAWCLQYNQHLGKTLLFPITSTDNGESGSNEDPERRNKKGSDILDTAAFATAQTFYVVDCGASGHNIRERPSLKALPVGKLKLGSSFLATGWKQTSEGCWVKLLPSSARQYCSNADVEAWSLAVDRHQMVYLRHEDEVLSVSAGSETKGAPKAIATYSSRETVEQRLDLVAFRLAQQLASPDAQSDKDLSLTWSTNAAKTSVSQMAPQGVSVNCQTVESAVPQPRQDSIQEDVGGSSTGSHGSVAAVNSGPLAAFQNWLRRDNSTPKVVKETPSPQARSRMLPPELEGVSVKELVRVMGESRSNGNASPSSSPKVSRKSGVAAVSSRSFSAHSSPVTKPEESYTNESCARSRSLSPAIKEKESSSAVASVKSVSQAGTQTSPEANKNANFNPATIDAAPEVSRSPQRLSPKAARSRDRLTRGPVMRPRKGRSPTGSTISHRASMEQEAAGLGISPSSAECVRAVFAANLWHQGLVHDAMACASFLKFHPNLPKQVDSVVLRKGQKTWKTREEKARQRHSVEIFSSNELAGPFTSALPVAVEENWTSERTESAAGLPPVPPRTVGDKAISSLTPTLSLLVELWEKMNRHCLEVIQAGAIAPCSMPSAAQEGSGAVVKDKMALRVDSREAREKERKRKVRKESFRPESHCELCGGLFLLPVTAHMRQAHPGCHKPALGLGYNPAGHYCGGWVGNCGEGGVQGSSWYLLCEDCRHRYLQQRRQVGEAFASQEDKSKRPRRKLPAASSSLPSQILRASSHLETQVTLKENALFLLQLASCSAPDKNQMASDKRRKSLMHQPSLSSVAEGVSLHNVAHRKISAPPSKNDYGTTADSVPWLRFQCLAVLKSGCSSPHSSHHEALFGDTETDHSCDPDVNNDSKESLEVLGRHLHRSVSMITQPLAEHLRPGREYGAIDTGAQRRRANSAEEQGVDGGLALLRSPSKALQDTVKIMSLWPEQDFNDRHSSLPVLDFVARRHDLSSLRSAMELALRKAACRVFAMENFSWLLQNVTQPVCLHDLLWWLVSSLAPSPASLECPSPKDKPDAPNIGATRRDNLVGQHPTADVSLAGEGLAPLLRSFHGLLQTVSNLMQLLPMGTPLLTMAVRCWDVQFKQTDHAFLHKSHVFSNISRILSRCEEEIPVDVEAQENNGIHSSSRVTVLVEAAADSFDVKVSSRTAMVSSLTDGSTETFWESGDEDRGKVKHIALQLSPESAGIVPRVVCVYVDNGRDTGCKVSGITFKSGSNMGEFQVVDVQDVDSRFAGWLHVSLPPGVRAIQLELKGPDNSLRVRQVRLLVEGVSRSFNGSAVHQRTCETETLRVFRLLTSQVFGRLVSSEGDSSPARAEPLNDADADGEAAERTQDIDLKEHMVGILFSGKKLTALTHLQRQVCSHILHGIQRETVRLRDEWDSLLHLGEAANADRNDPGAFVSTRVSDSYCFELLSQVLALSGSRVGRTYISQQTTLPADLLSLLHTGTPRIQRQVTALLRRVLPELSPSTFASLIGVDLLPSADYGILQALGTAGSPDRVGILDVFLACIAKALTVQVKTKGRDKDASKNPITSVVMSSIFNSEQPSQQSLGSRWWMRGTMPRRVAESITQLVRDLASGALSEMWSTVTKASIAEAVLSLTKVDEDRRGPTNCLQMPSLWLTLAALCLLQDEHVERLSSAQWAHGAINKPQCANHDDGETFAQIVCAECGPLCVDCDRVLHLSRKFRTHQRQVCKEEEEAIKVDVHEGCGRIKLFWILALSDARNLKSLVEFRHGTACSASGGFAVSPLRAGTFVDRGGLPCAPASSSACRYCGSAISPSAASLFEDQPIGVCSEPDCQEHLRNACTKTLNCGHPCGGVRGEPECLPCLFHCSNNVSLKQDADDMCMICFTEALSAAPAIQLSCKHVFHAHCCRSVLSKKWPGPRITFSFSCCPICKAEMRHEFLDDLLTPIRELFSDVKRKALMRLEYEGLHQTEAISLPGGRFFQNPEGFAMERYAYYVCFKCNKAYYGGEARCEADLGGGAEQVGPGGGAVGESFNPAELVCGACSDVSRAQMCPRHGADYLEYKCRYCCSVAVFFCFGTTHFCNACHEDFRHVTEMPKHALPKCPAAPRGRQLDVEECPLHVVHPPTGEEFALGCGICRNAHTF